jgi:hypothetical protein
LERRERMEEEKEERLICYVGRMEECVSVGLVA